MPTELRKSARRLGRKTMHRGYCYHAVVDDVIWPNGKRMKRDLILHPGITVILPLLDKDHAVLIRQYRYGAGGYLWELPAGTIGKSEKPLACAKREIEEEIGYRGTRWTPLASFFASPGFNTEIVHTFLAESLVKTKTALEDDEILHPKVFSLKQIAAMIQSKKIRDPKSLVPLFYYLSRRRML